LNRKVLPRLRFTGQKESALDLRGVSRWPGHLNERADANWFYGAFLRQTGNEGEGHCIHRVGVVGAVHLIKDSYLESLWQIFHLYPDLCRTQCVLVPQHGASTCLTNSLPEFVEHVFTDATASSRRAGHEPNEANVFGCGWNREGRGRHIN
jgi:hypothetical protein